LGEISDHREFDRVTLKGSDHHYDPQDKLSDTDETIQKAEDSDIRKNHHKDTGNHEESQRRKQKNRLKRMKPDAAIV
jgi:hypothetical protein